MYIVFGEVTNDRVTASQMLAHGMSQALNESEKTTKLFLIKVTAEFDVDSLCNLK